MKGVITNKKGEFVITGLSSGVYKINISFIGYQTKTVFVILDGKIKIQNLKSIYICRNVFNLNEVNIKGDRPVHLSFIDNDVYTPDSNTVKNAANALYVVGKAPGVIVNKVHSTVSMMKEENMLLLVNGVQQNDKMLKTIPPEKIDYIEIITAASAKYDS